MAKTCWFAPGERQNQGIDFAPVKLAQAGVDVAPDRHDIEVAPHRPDLRGPAILVDLETEQRMEVIPEYTRTEYSRKIDDHIEQLRTRTRGAGMDYHLLVTDQPLDTTLREYLAIRQGER